MKNSLLFLLPFCFLFSITSKIIAQKNGESTKQLIESILDQWHRNAAECNLESYISAMSPFGVFIGTDATERWPREEFREFCKPYFDQKRTWNFKSLQRHVIIGKDGKTAWFDELLSTRIGVCRGSGVLTMNGNSWKIDQYVLSATIPNEKMKPVTAMKASFDTTFIIKSVFDKYGMKGTMLIYDLQKNKYSGYEPVLWDSGYLPASTFKIVNTLIGLETGVIDSNFVFKWNGEKRRLPQWEKDLSLKEAFRVSCVPCYQELARKIGYERMRDYLQKFNYGNMVISPETIDLFWLEGESRITPMEQLDFLRRLYSGELPINSKTSKIILNIMFEEVLNGARLHGKTGWAIRNGNNYGWYVGFVEKEREAIFIVTFIQPKDNKVVNDFAMARKAITMEVLTIFNILQGKE